MSFIFKRWRSSPPSEGTAPASMDVLDSDSKQPQISTLQSKSALAVTVNPHPSSIFNLADFEDSKIAATVRQVLDDPILGARFRDLAASKFADEGIKFLDELQATSNKIHNYYLIAMRGKPSQRALHKASKALINKYIADGAPCCVNLPSSIRTALLDNFAQQKYKSVPALFNRVAGVVFADLKQSDLFREFCLTDLEALNLANARETLLLDNWLAEIHGKNTSSTAATASLESALQDVIRDDRDRRLLLLCSAIVSYELTSDAKKKKAVGFKTWSRYLQPGAGAYVANLPQLYMDSIDRGEYAVLTDVKIECLQRLSRNKSLVALAAAAAAASSSKE